jgi:hypothetical protein
VQYRQAFLYFNQNVGGFQNDGTGREDWTSGDPRTNLGWDFESNPLNIDGSGRRRQYVDYTDELSRDRTNGLRVGANFWDYISMFNPGIVGPVWVGIFNALRYNK